jgi:hypothetical protein
MRGEGTRIAGLYRKGGNRYFTVGFGAGRQILPLPGCNEAYRILKDCDRKNRVNDVWMRLTQITRSLYAFTI